MHRVLCTYTLPSAHVCNTYVYNVTRMDTVVCIFCKENFENNTVLHIRYALVTYECSFNYTHESAIGDTKDAHGCYKMYRSIA